MSNIFRCKQSIWIDNVSKITCSCFRWVNDVSRFNEDFIKNYNENSDVGYFLEVDVEYFI